jgi:hypothetical protein
MADKKQKNESEILFEQYLQLQGISNWQYEPKVPGKKKQPDYLLYLEGMPHVFEVKEFRDDSGEPPTGIIWYNPYSPIRQKIDDARDKFKEFKDWCCSLVLYNAARVWTDAGLDDPGIVMGSMLGDLGVQLTIDRESGKAVGEPDLTFSHGGKMYNYKRQEPQNTTISALLVLERFPLGKRRLSIECERKKKELGRELTVEELLRFYETLRNKGMDSGETVLRIVVYENPYARIPLRRGLFAGPFDERFGPEKDRILRIFAGGEIHRLEEEESALGLSAK